MSTRIVLSTVFIFASLAGCRSPQSQEVSPPPKEATSYIVPLESVIPTWDQYLADIHNRAPANHGKWNEDLTLLCARQEDLCTQSSKSSKKKAAAAQSKWAEAKKFLKEENFTELSQYTTDVSLKFFGRVQKAQMLGYADTLLKDQNCLTSDMRHALASMLEDHLPEAEAKAKTLALYEINSQCSEGRAMALSAYRAAMLRLLDKECDKALPLLEKVTTSTEEHLKPRSLYWSWKCQGESPTLKAAAFDRLPYFSYHRLLMEAPATEQKSDNRSLPEPMLEPTPIMMESVRAPLLNDFVRLAEKMLANQEPSKSRFILEKVKLERIQESEPEFQVYWAYMLHSSQSGIRKFQILSSLINNFPQYRTKAVKNMLFPNSYFEHVEASSKKLDPWLVQALIRQESAFDPRARSRVGATGLMQLMPSTARRVARVNRKQLNDPVQNVQVGVKFLEKLVEKFDGQVHLALAAYNAGPNKVEEWIKRYPTSDTMLFVDSIPYRETREYVAFILRNYHWYRSLNPITTAAVTATEAEPTATSEPSAEEMSDPDSMPNLYY